MKKKLLAVISAALVASMLLTGCGGGSKDSVATNDAAATDDAAKDDAAATDDAAKDDAASSETSGTGKIGMVVNNSGADPYQTSYYDTMVSYAKEKGVDLQILDPKGDATTQANQIQDLINMKCDAIIVWPVNGETAVASVRAINKAGIPCMTANTNVAESGEEFIKCYVGPSNVEEGKQSAQAMVEVLGNDAKIVEIAGPAGYTTSLERSQGLQEGIDGTNIQVLDSQTGEGNREKCQQVMENYLVKYGKGEIDAVFTFDDNAAFGAWNAIEAAGRQDDVKIFAAAAGSFETVQYVKDGKIQATAMQSPHFDAKAALDMAVKLAAGEEPAEFYNYIETPVATPDNVDSLGLEEW